MYLFDTHDHVTMGLLRNLRFPASENPSTAGTECTCKRARVNLRQWRPECPVTGPFSVHTVATPTPSGHCLTILVDGPSFKLPQGHWWKRRVSGLSFIVLLLLVTIRGTRLEQAREFQDMGLRAGTQLHIMPHRAEVALCAFPFLFVTQITLAWRTRMVVETTR